eukprot:EG_transcript_15689
MSGAPRVQFLKATLRSEGPTLVSSIVAAFDPPPQPFTKSGPHESPARIDRKDSRAPTATATATVTISAPVTPAGTARARARARADNGGREDGRKVEAPRPLPSEEDEEALLRQLERACRRWWPAGDGDDAAADLLAAAAGPHPSKAGRRASVAVDGPARESPAVRRESTALPSKPSSFKSATILIGDEAEAERKGSGALSLSPPLDPPPPATTAPPAPGRVPVPDRTPPLAKAAIESAVDGVADEAEAERKGSGALSLRPPLDPPADVGAPPPKCTAATAALLAPGRVPVPDQAATPCPVPASTPTLRPSSVADEPAAVRAAVPGEAAEEAPAHHPELPPTPAPAVKSLRPPARMTPAAGLEVQLQVDCSGRSAAKALKAADPAGGPPVLPLVAL